LIKLFQIQFGHWITYRTLLTTVGELSRFELLWASMGASRSYVVFTGLVEIAAGALLFFRRSATLGALLAVAALGQVLVIDLSYDVTVKAYAAALLLMAVYLCSLQAHRLAGFLLLNRRVEPEAIEPHFNSARANRVGALVKAVVLVWAVAYQIAQKAEASDIGPVSPLHGVYDVQALAVEDGAARVVIPAGESWTRLAIERSGFATLWLSDGGRRGYFIAADSAQRTVELVLPPEGREQAAEGVYMNAYTVTARVQQSIEKSPTNRISFSYIRTADGSLQLTARDGHGPATLHLVKWPAERFALLGCPTHLVNDLDYDASPTLERCPWYIR
jgi:hypothetical protein